MSQPSMTVAELRDALNKYPDDAEVLMWGRDDHSGGTITRIELESESVVLIGEPLNF